MMKIILASAALAVSLPFGAAACCYYVDPDTVVNWNDPDSFLRAAAHPRWDSLVALADSSLDEFDAQIAELAEGRAGGGENGSAPGGGFVMPRGLDSGKLAGYIAFRKNFMRACDAAGKGGKPLADSIVMGIPGWLEGEFRLYDEGAIRYRCGDYGGALAAFDRLLALPAGERPLRTVAAEYMRGRALYKSGRPADAREAYARCRKAALSGGFKDPENLAFESAGFEAQVDILEGKYARAVRTYFSIYKATGRDLGLRVAVSRAAQTDRGLENLASDPLASAFAACHFAASRESPARWIKIAGGRRAGFAHFGGLLALSAYNSGDYESARAALELSAGEDPMARWVESKFLIMDGDYKAASEIISKLVRGNLGDIGRICGDSGGSGVAAKVASEYGVLKFSEEDFAAALDCFVEAGNFEGAMFIAEIAMDAESLRRYCDSRSGDTRPLMRQVRWSLVLRMLKDGAAPGEILAYPDAAPRSDSWLGFDGRASGLAARIAGLREVAKNPSEDRRKRILANWEIFEIYDRLGTEVFAECYEPRWFPGERGGRHSERPLEYLNEPDCDAVYPTPAAGRLAEFSKGRIGAAWERFVPEKFFAHRAFDAGLAAAELMPDSKECRELAAQMYILAGNLMKVRNPQRADIAYKALVLKCGETRAGKIADIKRWFPPASRYAHSVLESLEGLWPDAAAELAGAGS